MDNIKNAYIEGIQSTSTDAFKMKISCVVKKYYDDPFILEMEKKKSHKNYLPLINRGTWSRVYSIKSTLEKILMNVNQADPTVNVNIINFGAGFDTLYFQLKAANMSNFKYIELDYPEICSKKIETIKKSELLQHFVDLSQTQITGNCLSYKDYHLFDCDITQNEKVNEKFQEVGLNNEDLTVVICECLLVYLSKDITYQILNNLTSSFKNLILIEYDLIGAIDGFGQEMIENLLSRNIKLYGYEDVPDLNAQLERLTQTGFTNAEVIDMLNYYTHCIETIEKKRIEKLEMMDEFEEWNLMQDHACFGYGTKLEPQFSYMNELLKLTI